MLFWKTKCMNEPYIQLSDEVKRYYYDDIEQVHQLRKDIKEKNDLDKRMIRHAINSVYGLTTDYNNEVINRLYGEIAQKIKEEKEMNEVWVCDNAVAWLSNEPIVVPNSRNFVSDIIAALIKRLFYGETVVCCDPTYVETDKARYAFQGVINSDVLGDRSHTVTIIRTKKEYAQVDRFEFVLKREMSTKDQTEKFFVNVNNNFNVDRKRMNDIFRNSNRNKMWQYRPRPKFVQFNGDYTTVVWKDGSHTVVKLAEGEEYDEEKAILFAIVKHMCGDVGCNMGRYFDEFYSHQNDVQSTEHEDWKKKRECSE